MSGGLTIETASTRLRHRFVAVATLGFAGLLALVSIRSGRLVIAVAVWATVVGYARYRLGQNYAPERDTPNGRLGIANTVTLGRGWLLALFAGIATGVGSSFVTGLFVCTVLLDAIDGAIARRTRETVLGTHLDGATDALTMLVGATVAVFIGSVPAWYLLAGSIWYGYSASLLFRRWLGATVYDLPESRLRRLIGSAQFLVIAVALWPAVSLPEAVAATALGALCVSFVRDWAVATGRIRNPLVG